MIKSKQFVLFSTHQPVFAASRPLHKAGISQHLSQLMQQSSEHWIFSKNELPNRSEAAIES